MATSTVMSLGELIDLAIGTPEVGVVDFCMIHTVLHCLAQQLKVTSKPVELRGNAAMSLPAREREETVAVKEYVMEQVDTSEDEDGNASEPETPRKKTKQKTLLVVEKVKKAQPSATPSGQEGPPSPDLPAVEESVIQKPQVVLSTEKLSSLVTISRFNILDATVRDLVDKVCGPERPPSPELDDVEKDPSELKPKSQKSLKEGSTSVNIFSRLEAAEDEIAKLNAIVQDLITENPELKTTSKIDTEESLHSSRKESPKRQSPTRDPTRETLKSTKSEQGETLGQEETEDWSDRKKLSKLKHTLDKIREELENVTNSFYTVVANMDVEFESSRSGSIHPSTIEDESAKAESLGEGQLSEVRKSDTHHRFVSSTRVMERIDELEKRWQDSMEKNCDDKISVLQQQLDRLSMQVSMFAEAGCIPTPNIPKDLEGLLSIFETVQGMQEELKKVHETAMQLAAEKDTRQIRFDALIEQVEYLKNIKLDRVVMEEAMAEKADLRMLARKVSYNQFEMACDDLSKGLDHTLGKLDIQETLWQQALDDIQREIEMKLDKMEFSPVKEAFNTKLKKIQENLKNLSKLRETDAAGTKRRLLKDVNCISCDAKAVMAAEAEAALPVLRALPPTVSMKPYLSYELDAIRKAQATNTPQRNMRDWEQIEKQMPNKYTKLSKTDKDKHLCNRYCGGSHTVVSPAQRVARTGHFVKQWGPDVIPLSSGLETGDDGRLYKVSTAQGPTPASTDIEKCTPKPKTENAKTQNFISECHCLEEEP